MSEFMAELVGTFILILMGDGVVANVLLRRSKGEASGWIVIATGWGLAVTFGVYAVGWISGAHLNPAVTLGLAAAGSFPWEKVAPYILGQMVGAFLGAVAVYLAYLPHWQATEDPALKLAVFSTAPAIRSPGANLLTEMIGTFMLLLGVGFIFNVNNGLAGGVGPLAMGFWVWSIGLSLGGPTGYAINPARDLAPRIAHAVLPIPGKGSSDWAYAWVPVVGPIIGGVLGGLTYSALWGI